MFVKLESWNFLRFHEIGNHRDVKNFSCLKFFDKQKSFFPRKLCHKFFLGIKLFCLLREKAEIFSIFRIWDFMKPLKMFLPRIYWIKVELLGHYVKYFRYFNLKKEFRSTQLKFVYTEKATKYMNFICRNYSDNKHIWATQNTPQIMYFIFGIEPCAKLKTILFHQFFQQKPIFPWLHSSTNIFLF